MSHGCQVSLSNTVTYLLQSMVAAASCCVACLENGCTGESRPRFKRFSATQEKGEDYSWVWGLIQVLYSWWGNGSIVERRGGYSEIGPFPTKRSNYVQKISTPSFWLFWFVQKWGSKIDNPSIRFVSFTKVEQHPDAWKFLNHKETIFSDIHCTCNSLLLRAPFLRDLGVGTPVCTVEGEKLWHYFHLWW